MAEEDTTSNYRIKDITFLGSSRRILLQSANGPCPLLGLCNVLLLRNQLQISQDTRYISFTELLQMVTNILFDANASSGTSSTSTRDLNVRENLTACLEILPRLNVGLDVNCKFAGPQEFEYTQELAVFDLLDINLFHGWVVSRQDTKAFGIFGHLSYNQIVEKLIAFEEAQQRIVDASKGKDPTQASPEAAQDGKDAGADSAVPRPGTPGSDPETLKIVDEGLTVKEFMDRTASQLSYEGLLALHEVVRERELAVFFRNSHFSTILKYQGDLYLLCTDIAFAQSHIVWEKLDEVDGNTTLCDAMFKENPEGMTDEAVALAAAQAAQEVDLAALQGSAGTANQATMDADAMLAWQMMQEDLQAQEARGGQARPAPGARAGPGQQVLPGQPVVHGYVQGTPATGAPQQRSAAAGGPAAKKKAASKKGPKSCTVQ